MWGIIRPVSSSTHSVRSTTRSAVAGRDVEDAVWAGWGPRSRAALGL